MGVTARPSHGGCYHGNEARAGAAAGAAAGMTAGTGTAEGHEHTTGSSGHLWTSSTRHYPTSPGNRSTCSSSSSTNDSSGYSSSGSSSNTSSSSGSPSRHSLLPSTLLHIAQPPGNSSTSSSSRPSLRRRIGLAGGLLIFSALVGAVVYSGFARQRRRVVLTYAPYKVGGSRAGSSNGGVLGSSPLSEGMGLQSVMGTYDCIPADRLLGGGVGSGSSSSGKKEKESGVAREEKKDDAAAAGVATEEKHGVRIEVREIDATAPLTFPPLPNASSFVSSNAAAAPAAPAVGAAGAAVPAVPAVQKRRPIPLIGTNLDYDTEGYLSRFVSSIPFFPQTSSTHKLIAWGGCDPMVASQIDTILTTRPDFRVYRSREKQGCAAGWNVILRYMAMHDREEVPWAIIFNADMYTPPGSLEQFGDEIWAALEEDPNLCIGFFNARGAGMEGRYTSYVFTRRALEVLGLFDENIYPAYYEDVEMDVRMGRAAAAGVCSPFRWFNSSEFVHGMEEGREGGRKGGRKGGRDRYVSGTKLMETRMRKEGDEEVRGVAREWSEKIKRGKKASPVYLHQKWGCKPEKEIDLSSCGLQHPFGNAARPLSYWQLDAGRRRCVEEGREGGVEGVCEYTLVEN